MPELPEVETIKRVLEKDATGRKITRVSLKKNRMTRGQSTFLFQTGLINRQILQVDRRGKYLIFRLEDKILLIHLGMSGQIISGCDGNVTGNTSLLLPDKHTHLTLWLSTGNVLYFRDPRMFGRYILSSTEEEGTFFANLGPEPLDPIFTPSYLYQVLKERTASIKALLLNQKIVAGLGNIYVDESLFRAGIHPATIGGRISKTQTDILVESIKTVITEAVNAGGTSISDFQDPKQRKGDYQHHLRVYGRKGRACTRCGSIVMKENLNQRGTHWCPQCQK